MERRSFYYILVDGKAVEEPDIEKWTEWFFSHDRRLVETKVVDAMVSTIFLGTDYSLSGMPELWETMVFGAEHDLYCQRYTSEESARIGHDQIVRWLQCETRVN